ncbi:ParA family protein, partial [Streptomyces albidoflavus]
MTSPETGGDRLKVVTKLTSSLRQELKVRAAIHGLDMQNAVEAGIDAWRALGSNLAPVDTSGAETFSTFL